MAAKQHDNYCWVCCRKQPSVLCSKCERSFHSKCSRMKDDQKMFADGEWVCSMCFKAHQSDQKDNQSELDMLPVIIDQVWKDESFESIKDILKDGIYPGASTGVIVNPISLTSISDNIKAYRTFDEFLADIHWIHHNCRILYTKKDPKTNAAALLVNFFNEEIHSVQSCCAECYMNALNHPNDWFTMVCDEAHLLVWASVKGYPYWPGKLMYANLAKDICYVRFFGKHDNAEVSHRNCYLYSEKNPGQPGYTSVPYNLAVKEAKKYLNNVKQKFGAYNLATSKTLLNITKIDKYIVDFIPGIVRHREAKRLNHAKRKIDDKNLVPSGDDIATPSSKKVRVAEDVQGEAPGPSIIKNESRKRRIDDTNMAPNGDDTVTPSTKKARTTEDVQVDAPRPSVIMDESRKRKIDDINMASNSDDIVAPSSKQARIIEVVQAEAPGPSIIKEVDSGKREIDDINMAPNGDDTVTPSLKKDLGSEDVQAKGPGQSTITDDSWLDHQTQSPEMTNENEAEPSQQCIMNDVNDSVTAQLNDPVIKPAIDIVVDEENVDLATLTPTSNVEQIISEQNDGNIGHIMRLNAKLEEELKELERMREIEKKVYGDINENLLEQIKTIKQTHLLELNQLNNKCIRLENKIWKLSNEHEQNLDLTKQQYSSLIDEAKNHKYCVECTKPIPLEPFVCDEMCQQNFWKRQQNSTSEL
ncbi:protein kinase C-binding protein 1-like [Contarinia nasturtii]|uniref:protein kinase C-binding protein 1-like n=1 Tax=Contarinia nasturtii TaxID=265458 RepID=UPI0012D3F35E|nr:protein kinase C-binding protein 1-like [Contarinia nasturtii]